MADNASSEPPPGSPRSTPPCRHRLGDRLSPSPCVEGIHRASLVTGLGPAALCVSGEEQSGAARDGARESRGVEGHGSHEATGRCFRLSGISGAVIALDQPVVESEVESEVEEVQHPTGVVPGALLNKRHVG